MELPSGWAFILKQKDKTTIEVEQKDLVICRDCFHSIEGPGGLFCRMWNDDCDSDDWCSYGDSCN